MTRSGPMIHRKENWHGILVLAAREAVIKNGAASEQFIGLCLVEKHQNDVRLHILRTTPKSKPISLVVHIDRLQTFEGEIPYIWPVFITIRGQGEIKEISNTVKPPLRQHYPKGMQFQLLYCVQESVTRICQSYRQRKIIK